MIPTAVGACVQAFCFMVVVYDPWYSSGFVVMPPLIAGPGWGVSVSKS